MGATPVREHGEDQSVPGSCAHPELGCRCSTLIRVCLQNVRLSHEDPSVLWCRRGRLAFALQFLLSAALFDRFATLHWLAAGRPADFLGSPQSRRNQSEPRSRFQGCNAALVLFGAALSHRAAPAIS